MKYFAYGSNMDPEELREWEVRYSSRVHAVLDGWRLEFSKVASADPARGYANITEDRSGSVEGCLCAIDHSDLHKLDRKEAYPKHYDRRTVNVRLDSGQEVPAVTYVAQPDKRAEGLKPTRAYMDRLLAGSDLLSADYVEHLQAVATLD